MGGENINDILKEIREIKEDIRNMATKEDIRNMATKEDIRNMATKEDIRNIKEDIRNIKEDIRNIEEKMGWLYFKFNTFRDVLSVSPTTRQRRYRNIFPPLCPAEHGINSTRVTKHYESLL